MVAGGIDGVLGALAEPTRRKVVELLSGRPLEAGEIAKAVRMTPTALSRHLRGRRVSERSAGG